MSFHCIGSFPFINSIVEGREAAWRSLPGPTSSKSGHIRYASKADGYQTLANRDRSLRTCRTGREVLAAACRKVARCRSADSAGTLSHRCAGGCRSSRDAWVRGCYVFIFEIRTHCTRRALRAYRANGLWAGAAIMGLRGVRCGYLDFVGPLSSRNVLCFGEAAASRLSR